MFLHFKNEIVTRLIREAKVPLEEVNATATKLATELAQEPDAPAPAKKP